MKDKKNQDVKDTKDSDTSGKPHGITAKNKSFPNYRPPREQMSDLQKLPKTRHENEAATKIAAMAQGEDTKCKKAEGFDKYNFKINDKKEMPNSAFLDK